MKLVVIPKARNVNYYINVDQIVLYWYDPMGDKFHVELSNGKEIITDVDVESLLEPFLK